MKIITHNDYPPIPVRNMDWSAWADERMDTDADDEGYQRMVGPMGHGATEVEAIRDLLDQLEDEVCDRCGATFCEAEHPPKRIA